MQFKTGDGIELYFELVGEGMPCLFLHGGPGYWSKSFQYFSKDLLEDDLRMIYLDQRGCGRSDHSLTQDYSLYRLIDDIEELRVFLGIQEWVIMGHSFGGILAVNYAHKFPDRIKGLILSNATLNMPNSFEHQIRIGSEILGIDKREVSKGSIHTMIDLYYSILSQLLEREEYFKFQYMDIDSKITVDLIDQDGLNSDPEFQNYVFSSKAFFKDFTSITEKISKPVLVVAGKHDNAVGPSHHKLFNFPCSNVIVLNSSHHPYIENRIEFKAAVVNFVYEISLNA